MIYKEDSLNGAVSRYFRVGNGLASLDRRTSFFGHFRICVLKIRQLEPKFFQKTWVIVTTQLLPKSKIDFDVASGLPFINMI
jgi:hypothetical protein